jgi:uncharacterized membrane protein SirB2
MSNQFYKIIHVVSIVLFFSTYAAAVVKPGSIKFEKILSGVAILLILVSGFGLLARLNVPMGAAWPLWVKVKLSIWIFIGALGHMVLKRFPKAAGKFLWASIGLLVVASYMANYKITL